jgi:hypothetical protein
MGFKFKICAYNILSFCFDGSAEIVLLSTEFGSSLINTAMSN